MKHKFKETTEMDQRVRSFLPRLWTVSKIFKEFSALEYLVKKDKNLIELHCILSDILTHQTDSRVRPDKKKMLLQERNLSGEKIHKQKWLVLWNLKELYIKYKYEHLNEKVGFSKFTEIRLKWCVLAESSGIHTVCVCVLHKNMKLMLNEEKLNTYLTFWPFGNYSWWYNPWKMHVKFF